MLSTIQTTLWHSNVLTNHSEHGSNGVATCLQHFRNGSHILNTLEMASQL